MTNSSRSNLPAGQLFSDVRALCQDRQGNLWLGTYGGGLVRLQPRTVRLLEAEAGLPREAATCLAQDPAGKLWLGFEHAGLFSGSMDHFERADLEVGVGEQNLISSLAVAPDSSLWVGTLGLGLYCCRGQRTIHYGLANGLRDLGFSRSPPKPTMWPGSRRDPEVSTESPMGGSPVMTWRQGFRARTLERCFPPGQGVFGLGPKAGGWYGATPTVSGGLTTAGYSPDARSVPCMRMMLGGYGSVRRPTAHSGPGPGANG